MKMKDWQERALKTFIQCFGGVLVPEIVILLNNMPMDVDTIWKVLFPIICSALAAGIAAVWNIILQELKKSKKQDENSVVVPYHGIEMELKDYDDDSSRN